MKKVLIFNKLKSQINFQDIIHKTLDEPMHPYMGLKWTNNLVNLGLNVDYLNNYLISKYKVVNFLHKYIFLPKKFSTLVVYSTNGLGIVTLLRLFNWDVNIVFFSLSKINPDGNLFKVLIRRILFITDNIFSNHIVTGLKELNGNISKFKNFTYFPFYTDVNYFNDKIKNAKNNIEYDKEFILIVGDITRDDFFVYEELSDIAIPIIRITRDKNVITNLSTIINKERGDMILSGISFEQLAMFYKNSKLCIVASKFDHWQPGGITSIVEALACEGICVCNSGGEIEKEFKQLCTDSNCIDPLFYFEYPKKKSLKNIVLKLLNSSKIELYEMKLNSQKFSSLVLNLSTNGVSKLDELINNYFI